METVIVLDVADSMLVSRDGEWPGEGGVPLECVATRSRDQSLLLGGEEGGAATDSPRSRMKRVGRGPLGCAW